MHSWRSSITRRRFLACGVVGGTGLVLLPHSASARTYRANGKLNIALIGVGGRGQWFVDQIPRLRENVVAMCDVNEQRAAGSFAKLPQVPKYNDFRKLLDERDKQVDAVIIATPDNTHAVIAMKAMKMGKHVYCEKPLTHDVFEARLLRDTAAKLPVATQMGNQGTASEAFRRGVELVQAGVIGPVREVHVYNNGGGAGDRPLPQGTQPVPDWLQWDLWLGPAADRPYHSEWLKWHTWRDFSTSQLGNWATHSANLPFKALKLDSLWSAERAGQPGPRIRLKAEVSGYHEHTFPHWAVVNYDVPPRGDLPPVRLTWYQGSQAPGLKELMERIQQHGLDNRSKDEHRQSRFTDHAGCLLVGSEGMLYAIAHNTSITLLPQAKFADMEGPPRQLPRSRGHENEWIEACKGGPPAMSNFNYGGPLTEFLMLGNVATRFEGELEFDPLACSVTNNKAADQALRREYRPGWSL